MDDEKIYRMRALYPRAMAPDPALMKTEYTLPGRQWILPTGQHAGQYGAEHCATRGFSWVGLMFPREDEYHAFPIDELKPSDSQGPHDFMSPGPHPKAAEQARAPLLGKLSSGPSRLANPMGMRSLGHSDCAYRNT